MVEISTKKYRKLKKYFFSGSYKWAIASIRIGYTCWQLVVLEMTLKNIFKAQKMTVLNVITEYIQVIPLPFLNFFVKMLKNNGLIWIFFNILFICFSFCCKIFLALRVDQMFISSCIYTNVNAKRIEFQKA